MMINGREVTGRELEDLIWGDFDTAFIAGNAEAARLALDKAVCTIGAAINQEQAGDKNAA